MLILSIWLSNLADAVTGRARSVARPRAASLLEYVLLAAVVLVVVAAFGVMFKEQVGNLIDNIGNTIGGADTGS